MQKIKNSQEKPGVKINKEKYEQKPPDFYSLKMPHTYRIFPYGQLEILLQKFIISMHQWFKSTGIFDNINEPLSSWDKKVKIFDQDFQHYRKRKECM